MNNTPAGWYPSTEHNDGRLRYWNGTQWTEDYAAPTGFQQPPAPAPRMNAYDAVPANGPWWGKTWVKVTGGVVAALVVIGALSDSDSEGPEVAASAAQPTETVTVDAETEPEPEAEPTESTPVERKEPARVGNDQPADNQVGSQEQATGDTFPMPNEVGKVLQAAQDDLQAISGNPFFVSFSEDATGQDRMQFLDSGWQICDQTPAPGAPVNVDNSTDVTFFVVEVEETCP